MAIGRLRQRRRCVGLLAEEPQQLARRTALGLQLDAVRRRRDRAVALDEPAVFDQTLHDRGERRGRNAEAAAQLLARHARAKWVRAVIRGHLIAGARRDRLPYLRAEDPVPHPARVQPLEVGLRRHAGFEQGGHRHAARVFAQLLLEHVSRSTALERPAYGRVMARMLARRHVDEAAAGNRRRRTRHPQHKPVLVRGGDRALEVQLDPALTARPDLLAFEHDHPGRNLRGPGVEQKLRSMANRLRRGWKHTELCIHAPCRPHGAHRCQHVAPRQLALLDPGQVGRHPAAGPSLLDLLVVALESADAHRPGAGHDLHLVADADRSVHQGAGDHCAKPAHQEYAIDGQAGTPDVRPRIGVVEERVEG